MPLISSLVPRRLHTHLDLDVLRTDLYLSLHSLDIVDIPSSLETPWYESLHEFQDRQEGFSGCFTFEIRQFFYIGIPVLCF